MKQLEPIQDRIDALASQALEQVIGEAEAKDAVKVTDVQVKVADAAAGHPALDVSVQIKRVPT